MTQAKNTGGVQPWSAGPDYPYSVIGVGYPDGSLKWKGVNLHHDIDSPFYLERDTYQEAVADIRRLQAGGELLKQYQITEIGTFQFVLHDLRSGSFTIHRSQQAAVIALFGAGTRDLINE